ncbi:transaldolase family protein [Neptunicella sp. SCSIO 80796]|uniref:transaldolase family protein n=1 Tax=Neptunicella plasticusilytica TaxID=3117012 RepID=UPI003A4E1E9E
MNKLEQLKTMTTVVADTGDIRAIKQYRPIDATTNPSLVLKAAKLPVYRNLLEQAVSINGQQANNRQKWIRQCADQLAINIGVEIINHIPGRISTEVDARLSFDRQKTIKRAMEIVEGYSMAGGLQTGY